MLGSLEAGARLAATTRQPFLSVPTWNWAFGAHSGGLLAVGALPTLGVAVRMFTSLTSAKPEKDGEGRCEQEGLFQGGVFHFKQVHYFGLVKYAKRFYFLPLPSFALPAFAAHLHSHSGSWQAPQVVKSYCILAVTGFAFAPSLN